MLYFILGLFLGANTGLLTLALCRSKETFRNPTDKSKEE